MTLEITLGQKIQHKMVHDSRSLLTEFADKVAVKERVGNRIGYQYVVPTFEILEDAEALNFAAYPREFVLKPSHGSQAGVLVHDEAQRSDQSSSLGAEPWNGYLSVHPGDLQEHTNQIRERSRVWLASKYQEGIELCYAAILPRLIIERYIRNSQSNLTKEFRMYTFHGKVRFFRTSADVASGNPLYTFDEFGAPLNVRGEFDAHIAEGSHPSLPAQWEEMKLFAEILSEGVDFVRVDFYFDGLRIYFSEITNYPLAGNVVFSPDSFNQIASSYWKFFDCCP